MARPLRLEFPGAVYHLTARGDRREPIFIDDADREALLGVVGKATERFGASMMAYCLMGNHYHFVVQTHRANLSQLMRQINGVYTQGFNRRHAKVGHVFQGRFKALVVDRDAYLLEVCRYVELNPVRAGMVDDPAAWPWSSCCAHLGLAQAPAWLDSAGLLGALTGAPVDVAQAAITARRHYATFLAAGRNVPLWPQALRQQIYLGDEAFIERTQAAAGLGFAAPGSDRTMGSMPMSGRPDIPRAQLRPPRTLRQWLALGPSREQALRRANVEGGLSLTAMARELGLSVSRVSRLVARAALAQK